MSRANISGTFPDPQGGAVVFNCRNGEVRSYHYDIPDFLAILGGADPAEFTPNSGGGSAIGELADVGEAGEAALDISEGIADIGFLL